MKKAFLICALALAFITLPPQVKAQSPGGFNYQAVARNSSGTALSNQNIALRFTIRDSSATGPIVYRETQSAITNHLGLFTAKIGMGTAVQGTFAAIPWPTGDKYLEVEMDANNSTNYTSM